MEIDSLKQMFDMHIKECDQRDVRNTASFAEMKTMVKGIWDSQDSMKSDITKIQIKMGIAVGVIMIIGEAFHYLVEWHK